MAYNRDARWSVHARQGEGTAVASTTYTLPDLPWAVLLGPIVRDARPGDIVVVYTDAMLTHVEQVVQAAGRTDLVIRQVAPPPSKQVA